MNVPEILFNEADKEHKIVYEDSEQGRMSMAHRVIGLCWKFFKRSPLSNFGGKDCQEMFEAAFVKNCKKASKQSEEVCADYFNNAIWHVCDATDNMLDDCKKFKYKVISTLDTSAPWLWGVGGLLIGAMIAAGVWVLVYCLFLRKKAPKN